MMMTDPNDDMLDDLFAQARAETPDPSQALVARVLADADTALLAPVQVQTGLFTRMLDMIGGWPAMGGLAAATIAGIWVGVAPPPSVEDFTAAAFGEPVAIGIFAEDLDFDMGDVTDG
jgi:hypothetical protein